MELPLPQPERLEGSTEAAARSGDRAAWGDLISRYNRRVVMALMAHGILPAQAKEMAQEAWLKLMVRADAQRLERLELPGLAIRQALYLAQSEQRRTRNQVEEQGVSGELEAMESSGESMEESFFNRERLRKAQERLEALSPSARAIFERLYSEPQLSHAEVASRVGLSVQRVRQIICEVRKVLRTELEGE